MAKTKIKKYRLIFILLEILGGIVCLMSYLTYYYRIDIILYEQNILSKLTNTLLFVIISVMVFILFNKERKLNVTINNIKEELNKLPKENRKVFINHELKNEEKVFLAGDAKGIYSTVIISGISYLLCIEVINILHCYFIRETSVERTVFLIVWLISCFAAYLVWMSLIKRLRIFVTIKDKWDEAKRHY